MLIIQVLNVTQVTQHWYTDIYRSVMWFIGKGILTMLDGFFNIIDKIWRYKFFDNDYVNKIFGGAIIVACSWLTLKVVIELIMNYIVKNDGRGSPLSIYRGIVLAIVMMFLVAPLFDFGHKFSTSLTDSVISVSGMNTGSTAESTISKAIVRAMVYEDETKSEHITYVVDHWKDVDINDTEGGVVGIGDKYKYSLNFFMLIVLAVVTIFLLFFVAIQMAKRVMEIALYKIIGPFCCTSLTNNGKAFETWCKSSMGVFLVTVVQFVCIGLLLNMFGSAFTDNGTLTGIFLTIGALLFVISTPTIINSLLGQTSGMMSAFGDMQSLMAVGSGVSQGLGIAKAGTMGALSMGANVVGKGANLVSGGVDKISSMLNRGKTLTEEQKNVVKESMAQHNPRKAQQQVNDFLNQNSKGKYGNSSMRMDNSNPFKQPFSMRYNPIRNQYMNQSGLEANNNIDRKWY